MDNACTTEELLGDLDDRDEVLRLLREQLSATPAGLEDWLHPAVDDIPADSVPGGLIDDSVDTALRAIETLVIDQHAQLDGAGLQRLAIGVEKVRRSAEAAAVAVAERVDATNPFRTDGFFTGKNWLRHRLQLSKVDAFRRVQMARMQPRFPEWTEAAVAGEVGISQTMLMAQIAANPRLPGDQLRQRAPELLDDAINLQYEEFKAKALRWESLADPQGAADKVTRTNERRHALMNGRDQGGWALTARFDEIGGAEFNNVFAHYTQAEFEADWAEAVRLLGEGNVTPNDLRRTDLQRRADALVAMARAAAACPPGAMRPVPVLNVEIDYLTFEILMKGEQVPESRFRDVVCRTPDGRELDLSEAAGLVFWAEIRRVLLDGAGLVINYGRRRRCFTGAAREAALLSAKGCIWPGCPVPPGRCEVDHARSWQNGGGTDQDNGDPLCRGHNLLKEHGYRVRRDGHGAWHIYHPDGREII